MPSKSIVPTTSPQSTQSPSVQSLPSPRVRALAASMEQWKGDIWWLAKNGAAVVVPINQGLVHGRGLARQMADQFPGIVADMLGWNRPYVLWGGSGREVMADDTAGKLYAVKDEASGVTVLPFPVKWHWRDKADLRLIQCSAQRLAMNFKAGLEVAAMPRVGCGFGELHWEDVLPVLLGPLEPWLAQVIWVEADMDVVGRKYRESMRPGVRTDRATVTPIRKKDGV